MLNIYIEDFTQFLIREDIKFHDTIVLLLKNYSFPENSPSFFIAHAVYFIKVSVYVFVILFPFTFLKVAFSEKRWVNIVFWILLATFAVSVFGVVLAFFQLAFM